MKRCIPMTVLVLLTSCATIRTKWHETFAHEPAPAEMIVGDWAMPVVDPDHPFTPPVEGEVPQWKLGECANVFQFYASGEFHEIARQGGAKVDYFGRYSFFGDRSLMLRYAKENRNARLDYEFRSRDSVVFRFIPGSGSGKDKIEPYYRFRIAGR